MSAHTSPRAAVLVIGNEILSGRTHDTNSHWIAQHLVSRGITLSEIRVVADKKDAIVAAVHALRAGNDYLFTTGGIGPTHDDITAECIAAAFGVPYEMHADAFDVLQTHYGAEEFTPARQKMAMMPRGASLIPNPVSGAPGFVIGNVYVMAGVPRIMQAMFEHILSGLVQGEAILSSTVMCSLPESVIAEKLAALQGRFTSIDIGSYPQYRAGRNSLSLVLRGTDLSLLGQATQELAEIIRSLGDEPHVMAAN